MYRPIVKRVLDITIWIVLDLFKQIVDTCWVELSRMTAMVIVLWPLLPE